MPLFLLLFYALFICFKNGFSMNCLSILCLCMYLAYLTALFALSLCVSVSLSLIYSFHWICLRFSFISSFISKLVYSICCHMKISGTCWGNPCNVPPFVFHSVQWAIREFSFPHEFFLVCHHGNVMDTITYLHIKLYMKFQK